MKDKLKLVKGWLRKSESEYAAMKASAKAGSLDIACFHAQQAAEKLLNAYFIHKNKKFPFTHNLSRLVLICAEIDESFNDILSSVEPLTPYVVELRYDYEFFPEYDDVHKAIETTRLVRRFVMERINEP